MHPGVSAGARLLPAPRSRGAAGTPASAPAGAAGRPPNGSCWRSAWRSWGGSCCRRPVPAELPLRAHAPAVGRVGGARPRRLPAHLGQQHPRARVRPAPEGQQGTGGGNDRPGRSDTIMLIRTGGGHAARLSIPRDTVVEIPGHGLQKINAAHEFGGPALSISVIEHWLDIPINHLVEVNFENFPQLIDAMGGVTYTGGCIVSRPGRRLQQRRLHAAAARRDPSHRRQAGARDRAHPKEPVRAQRDRHPARGTPAGAVQRHEVAPAVAVELPAHAADRLERPAGDHLRHERRGTARPCSRALTIGGTPPTHVLNPTGSITLPSGEEGLTVSEASRRARSPASWPGEPAAPTGTGSSPAGRDRLLDPSRRRRLGRGGLGAAQDPWDSPST